MLSPTHSTISSVSTSSRKRKTVENEELNTKTFKMADLIGWRPKEENKLRKKWDDKRKELKERDEADASTSKQEPSTSQAKSSVAAPRVKLNEKGEIIVDAESLVITERIDDNAWTTVNEDLMPKKLNSMSFKKNMSARSLGWTDEETELFYFILNATGPDFGLMHDFMPTRTRAELKKKFKKEERINMDKINETLKKPALLDEQLKQKAKKMLEKIEGVTDNTSEVEGITDASEVEGVTDDTSQAP